MKKIGFILIGFLVLTQCKSPKNNDYTAKDSQNKYTESIKEKNLKSLLYTISSDEFEGRETGEEGQKKAAEYIADFYRENDIDSAWSEGYFQEIPAAYYNHKFKDTENVMAFIEGKEFPDEIVVVSAHYDHLGVNDKGEIYNGADDDGSGTVAVMEMAKAFKKAERNGDGPKRSLLFLHFTGEEKGLLGSQYYTENPVFPLEQTVSNLNTDMIGRIDDKHSDNSEYIYVIGSDRLSSELDSVVNRQNRKYTDLELDYKFNEKDDPNRFYYRSDHYNFAKHNIPVVFFFSGVHEDYHQPGDTADKIEYDLMTTRTKLIFNTVWEVANRDEALKVDKAN